MSMELDTSCFRAFQAAAQTLNFTEAARQVGMTQSGVSQHVAKLEQDLGDRLFLRIGKKVTLTEAGKKLLQFIETYQDRVSLLKDEIQENKTAIKGRISYSMPATCLLSPHFALFLEHRRENFPDLEVIVNLHASEEVIGQVLAGSIDFGFVTKKIPNDELDYQPFCEEEYVLISNSRQLRSAEEWAWITFPGSEVLLEAWMHHQEARFLKSLSHKVCGGTNSLHAALRMVAEGLGVTVVPRHCVEASDLRSQLKIHELGKKASKNMIYIVSLASALKPRRVQVTIDTFQKIKSK